MREIIPNVFTFTGLIAGRVYALRDNDGLTLVDTGSPLAGEKILAQLKAAGHRPTDVKRILITHAHPDHVGALTLLQQATGAEVWCHALEKPVIQGEAPIAVRPGRLTMPATMLKPVQVNRTLEDGDVLPVLGGLQVVATPGHAPGHISFWQADQRLVITGDVVFYLFNRMTLPFGFLTVDMDENKRSVQKLAALQPDVLLFGHGQPIIGQAYLTLSALIQRLGLGEWQQARA